MSSTVSIHGISYDPCKREKHRIKMSEGKEGESKDGKEGESKDA
jgi:hypothetical protein